MPTGMPASGGSGSPLAAMRVDARGLRQRALFGQAQVDVQARIDLLDALVVAGGEIGGLGAARGNLRAQRGKSLRLLNVGFGSLGFARQWRPSLFLVSLFPCLPGP